MLRKVQAWLFGAFSPINGKRLLIEADGCDSDFFQVFLDELSVTDSEELMLILLDNASFHKTKKLKIPDNIALILVLRTKYEYTFLRIVRN